MHHKSTLIRFGDRNTEGFATFVQFNYFRPDYFFVFFNLDCYEYFFGVAIKRNFCFVSNFIGVFICLYIKQSVIC